MRYISLQICIFYPKTDYLYNIILYLKKCTLHQNMVVYTLISSFIPFILTFCEKYLTLHHEKSLSKSVISQHDKTENIDTLIYN